MTHIHVHIDGEQRFPAVFPIIVMRRS